MKRFINILPLVILYLLLSSKSCDNIEQGSALREQSMAAQARDSITSVFESEKLAQPELRAFEVTARLMLKDLADFMKIIGDSTAGQAFRDKASEMAGGLFIPGNKVPLSFAGAVFDSIRVYRPLQRMNDTVYSGKLSVVVLLSHPINNRRVIPPTETKIVDIFVLKQKKVFGKDTLKVWKAFLGDLR